jgi:chemotaxis protein histidine kinase CheA
VAVDSKTSLKKQTGVTPAKLILIGVLCFVLLAVLYIQFGSSHEETPIATSEPLNRASAAAASTAAKPADENKQPTTTAGAAPKKTEITSNWQTTDVAAAIQYDPFALPPLFPQRIQEAKDDKLAKDAHRTDDSDAAAAARAENRKQLTTEFGQLQHQGVRVVMEKHDKFVAMIGDKTVHVGDNIDGFTVVAIDADGVRVARDLKQ